ncbi:MAG: hypothetical protein IJT18_08100 [Oscillospiraceae bacterium]|nr:hypothetical protein [Oscillospiraceae bacterium]
MTLGDGIRKVYMLLDEYSSGGVVTVDPDIEKKMADFFDVAQKDVAGYKRIIKEQTIPLESGTSEYPLPNDLSKIFRVWVDGELTNRYVQKPGVISFPDTGSGTHSTATVEYFAVPATITQSTPEDYVFEVCEEAANCMPFFVAAQNLMPDLVVDYSAFLQQYYQMRGALDVTLPEGDGSGGALRQTLFL